MLSNSRLASAALSALLALSSHTLPASATPVSYCPIDGICYQVGVPASSASSDSGNIYLQLRAPTTYSWVALGTGTSMTGSNMFVMYTDGAGNVTVSARTGTGHVPPEANAETQLELLEGSGVDGDVMLANVRCGNCGAWTGGSMSLSASSTDWISAWLSGAAIASADADAQIGRHDEHAEFSFDLAQAQVDEDANPFAGAGASTGDGDTAAGSGSGAGEAAAFPWYLLEIPRLESAHGIIMAIVMVVMYPLGSLLMPVFGKWWLHGVWQMVAWLAMWAGFAIGIVLAQRTNDNFTTHHTNLGTAVVALFGVQPALGYLHHMHYVRAGTRGAASHAHLWWGRALMVLGIVNGGLGLQLSGAGAGDDLVIAYSVVAAVVFAAYVASAVFGEVRRARSRPAAGDEGRREGRRGGKERKSSA